MKKIVLLIMGTRPEIIKMAPVYHALKSSNSLEPYVLHTGQHTDLATPVYALFDIKVNTELTLDRGNGTLAALSTSLLKEISEVINKVSPASVLVHGDTSSAVMGALAAFYSKIPIGHVEAGLRTYDKYSPFPEEMNRTLIGRLADWHYAPTEIAVQALEKEGLNANNIKLTGNTVIDAALFTADRVKYKKIDKKFKCESNQKLLLVTAHRRENWGEGLVSIANAVVDILEKNETVKVIWPLHANPAIAKAVYATISNRGFESDRLVLCEPQDYETLIYILNKAWLVLTDSGGIQEEAAAFGAPVLILRDTTERPELVNAGGGVLVGADTQKITKTFFELVDSFEKYGRMKNIKNPFGDGTAANIIVDHLEKTLKLI